MQHLKNIATRLKSRKLGVLGLAAAGTAVAVLTAGGSAGAASGSPAIGATTYSGSQVTIGYGTPTQVMSLTAPVSGTYYVSSSLEVLLSQNSDYGCLINYTQDVHLAGPYSMTNYSTMALDSSVSVSAGSPIIVTCMTYAGTATFMSGSINAILVGSSNGTTNTATASTAKSPTSPLTHATPSLHP